MLNNLMITALCVNSSILTEKGCQPTAEAITRQVGLYENVNLLEKYGKNRVLSTTPELFQKTIAYGFVGYRISSDKLTKFNFKFTDLCDMVEIGMSKSVNTMNLKWNF